ncbi:hypothetical protein QVD99_006547 [Batrachochytrium dendrobatidis]|nr:hypothetical protein QVD99_006547 [Batrachochytrium dendrobatidis]
MTRSSYIHVDTLVIADGLSAASLKKWGTYWTTLHKRSSITLVTTSTLNSLENASVSATDTTQSPETVFIQNWLVLPDLKAAFKHAIAQIALVSKTKPIQDSLLLNRKESFTKVSLNDNLKSDVCDDTLHLYFISSVEQPLVEQGFEYRCSNGDIVDLRLMLVQSFSELRGSMSFLALKQTVKMTLFIPGNSRNMYFSMQIPHIDACCKRYKLSKKNGEQLLTAQILDTLNAVFISIKDGVKLSYLCHGKSHLFKDKIKLHGPTCEFELLKNVDVQAPMLNIHDGPMLSLQTWNVPIESGKKLRDYGKSLLIRVVQAKINPVTDDVQNMHQSTLTATHCMHFLDDGEWGLQRVSETAKNDYQKALLKRKANPVQECTTDLPAEVNDQKTTPDSSRSKRAKLDSFTKPLRDNSGRQSPTLDKNRNAASKSTQMNHARGGAVHALNLAETIAWEEADRLKKLTHREEQDLLDTTDRADGGVDTSQNQSRNSVAGPSDGIYLGSTGRRMQMSYLVSTPMESWTTNEDAIHGNIMTGETCTFGQLWFDCIRAGSQSAMNEDKAIQETVSRRDFDGYI